MSRARRPRAQASNCLAVAAVAAACERAWHLQEAHRWFWGADGGCGVDGQNGGAQKGATGGLAEVWYCTRKEMEIARPLKRVDLCMRSSQ